MPLYNLSQEQILVGKMERVCLYMRSLGGKTFGNGEEGGKNRMAKVVVFNVNFAGFLDQVKEYTQPFAAIEIRKLITRLDFLIDLSNSTDESWDSFWAGEHIFKPEDYNIMQIKDGKQVLETLLEVEKITILK